MSVNLWQHLRFFFGDMNCNLLGPNVLSDTRDIFGLTNLVTGPTCFKSETLVDVMITNKPKCFSGRVNIDFGCNDFHNFIAVASRMYVPEMPTRKITYRCMKHFSDQSFLEHIECVPVKYLMTLTMFTRFVKGKQLPYMNSDLRKAINQRNMWRSRHFRDRRCKIARKRYTTLRNKVVKLQHKSVQHYFDQKCSTQAGYRNFYKVVKPVLSHKSFQNNNGRIILREEENIISEPANVAEIFNMYYSSLAQYHQEHDGLDTTDFAVLIDKHSSHSSVEFIKKNMSSGKLFDFSVVSVEIFTNMIYICYWQPCCWEAIGYDGLNAKFLNKKVWLPYS